MNVYALIALLSAVAAAAGGAGAAPTGVHTGDVDSSLPTFTGSDFDTVVVPTAGDVAAAGQPTFTNSNFDSKSSENTHDQATFTGSNFDGEKSFAAADDNAEEREQRPTFTGSDFDMVADNTPATQGRKHILPIKDDGEFHILPVKDDEVHTMPVQEGEFHILPVNEDEFHTMPVKEDEFHILPVKEDEFHILPAKIPDVMHGKVYSSEDAGKRYTMPVRPVERATYGGRVVLRKRDTGKRTTLPILPVDREGEDGEMHILPVTGDNDGDFHIMPYPYPIETPSQSSADSSEEGQVWIQPVLNDTFGIAGAACGHRDGFNRYVCADSLHCVRPGGALAGPGTCQSSAKLGQSCNGPSRVPCARGTFCSATLRGDAGGKWGVCKPIFI